jgi:hypothetical protein
VIFNFSSEAPDKITFNGVGFPIGNPDDPIGPVIFTDPGCVSVCTSNVSQDDADSCAAIQAYLCQHSGGGGPGNPLLPVFYNDQQSCSFPCPDGSLFTWTVLAGFVVTGNQDLSNRIAENIACARAAQRHICLPPLNNGCLNDAFSQVINVSTGVGPFVFTITAGALPPGVTMTQTDDRNALIAGTPTAAGSFPFTLTVQDPDGNYMAKAYTFQVLGITPTTLPDATKGTAYSQVLSGVGGVGPYTFALELGDLPDGMTLADDGTISGTPTETGDFPMTISISDSGAGFCTQDFTLKAKESAVCPVQLNQSNLGLTSRGIATYANTTDVLHPNKIFTAWAETQDFKIFDADTFTNYTTIVYPDFFDLEGAAFATGHDKIYALLFDLNSFTFTIQIINAAANTIGGTIDVLPDGPTLGYFDIRYFSAIDRIACVAHTSAAGMDGSAVIINPTTNAVTSFACVVNPGGGKTEFAQCLAYGKSGATDLLVVGCYVNTTSATIRTFNASTNAAVATLSTFPLIPISAVWSPNNQRVMFVGKHFITGACSLLAYDPVTNTIDNTVAAPAVFNSAFNYMDYWPNKDFIVIPQGAPTLLYFFKASDLSLVCSISLNDQNKTLGFYNDQMFISGYTTALLTEYH